MLGCLSGAPKASLPEAGSEEEFAAGHYWNGKAFAPYLSAPPSSAFLVEGSEVTVSEPSPLFSLADG